MKLSDLGLDISKIARFVHDLWSRALFESAKRFKPYSVRPNTYPSPLAADPYAPNVKKIRYKGGYYEYKIKRTGIGQRTFYLTGRLHTSLTAREKPSMRADAVRLAITQDPLPYWGTRSGITTVHIDQFELLKGNDIFSVAPVDETVRLIESTIDPSRIFRFEVKVVVKP
jgi:hypothetical protein